MNKYKISDIIKSKYFKYALSLMAGVILSYLGISFLKAVSPAFKLMTAMVIAVMKPLIIGLVLSYLLAPMVNFFVDKLEKNGKSHRGLAVLICLLIIFAGIGIIIFLLVSLVSRQIKSINFEDVEAFFNSFQMNLIDLNKDITSKLTEYGFDIKGVTSKVGGIVTGVAGAFSTLLFGIIFSVYFLYDGRRIKNYWLKVGRRVLPDKWIITGLDVLKDADKCFSGYIRGQAIDALIVGVLASVALTIAGIPYSIVIGAVVGFGNLIPYAGPLFGYGMVILVNIINFNPRLLVTGLIIVAVIMFIDANILNPKLLAGSVQVHPLLVVASLIAGGAIGGLLGMLLAVPVGALIKVRFEKRVFSHDKEGENNRGGVLP